MQNRDPYEGVASPADFLTQCMTERATLTEYVNLVEHAFVPMWSHGRVGVLDVSKACRENQLRARALRRIFSTSKHHTKQGFALMRMALGEDMFDRRVVQAVGQGQIYPQFAREMESFEDCNSVSDVQATLLAFTDAGKLYEGYGRPEMQSRRGEVYSSRAVYAQLQAFHYIVGYTANRLHLRRGTVVDVRGWMGDISSWGNLRKVVARTANGKAFEKDSESFYRVLESGIAERLPELESQARVQPSRDAEEIPRTVLRRY